MIPGEIILSKNDVIINEGKDTILLNVTNSGDRAVQIGSHFHFFEVNKCLSFNREKAYGFRLDIPAGTATRMEPGETQSLQLVKIGGRRKVCGANGMVNGYLDENKAQALSKIKDFK